ncbi:allatostatin-A receptor-like [Gigantopelta aegis]|uniref:allatostatin-A receptor-like n=1 Tax=Gigantopelta aegis TaxID=1735272 RepID=UPI001B888FEA|nr:allatostatin-A receptor-like [Gigantopelta aegis]
MMDLELPTQETLMVIILMSLTGLVGIIANTIMLRSLIKYPKLRTDIYVCAGGLAAADMLHLAIAVPSHIINFVGNDDVITPAWCKASRYIADATSYIGPYHIVILAVLRGIMLTNRGYRAPTGRHAFICSCLLWVIAPLATVPVIQMYSKFQSVCYWVDGVHQEQMWLTGAFSCFVPLAMVLLVYAGTYYVGQRYFSESYSRKEREISRLVSSVVVAFIICELPYQIMNLYTMYRSQEVHMDTLEAEALDTLYVVNDYLLCLALVDKTIRPVLYSKLSTDMGECFDEIINCTYCSRYYTENPKQPVVTQNSTEPLTGNSIIEVDVEEVV